MTANKVFSQFSISIIFLLYTPFQRLFDLLVKLNLIFIHGMGKLARSYKLARVFRQSETFGAYWAIAVKICYPPVDDNVFGNPHSLSYKVWEIQTKTVKLNGKSVKIS